MYIDYIYNISIYNTCIYDICCEPHFQINTHQRAKGMFYSCRTDLCPNSLVFQSVTFDLK